MVGELSASVPYSNYKEVHFKLDEIKHEWKLKAMIMMQMR